MKKRAPWLCWIGATLGAIGLLGARLQSRDRTFFLPNETTSGHYQIEVDCESCHTPMGGVRQEACMTCHEQELKEAEDSHPKSKFTDPRNADRVEKLEARVCVTCHVEHRPTMTGAMGVTLPTDFCFHCHADVGKDRPSHKDIRFDSCMSAGCHNFHDNRALYKDFLIKHANSPETLSVATVRARRRPSGAGAPLRREAANGPKPAMSDGRILEEWSATAHAAGGVNCADCHRSSDVAAAAWVDRPDNRVCQSCHQNESTGFLAGRHGMRLAADLTPMSPAMARLPMKPEAHSRILECGSCHASHKFDTRAAAVDACLGCHADRHSLSYKASLHFALWQMEADGAVAAGSGVSCATCHLPREGRREDGAETVRVQHNQNANLRPNEKMIRGVCQSCHGLGFAIDALADPVLIENNFKGFPSRHIESIDMAVRNPSPQGENR
jgi:hypothetical protein